MKAVRKPTKPESPNGALRALWDALDKTYEPPPPEAITAYDYAAKYRINYASASSRLGAMADKKQLQTGKFRHPETHKELRYYWLPK